MIPQVTILMPVYNVECYVRDAVSSILSQTLREIELLVFDDGSTDRSVAILREMAAQDSRIRVIAESHRGYLVWLNKGIEMASGKYIARMDADDVAHPLRLERQASFLDANLDHVAVGCQYQAIDPEGEILNTWNLPTTHEAIDARHIAGIPSGMLHPALMARTQAMRKLGGYRPHLEWVEDYDMYLRLAEIGKLANLGEPLMKYRLHSKSVTSMRSQRQAQLVHEAWRDAHQRRGLPLPNAAPPGATAIPNENPKLFRVYWAQLAMLGGNSQAALKNAWKGVRSLPLSTYAWGTLVQAMHQSKQRSAGSMFAKFWLSVLELPRRTRKCVRSGVSRLPYIWRFVNSTERQ